MTTPPTQSKIPAAASEPGAPPWLRQVALLTGVLAALGGYLTVRSTNLSNEAIYHSTQGVFHQAQASDAWAEFQANSIKACIVETQLAVGASDGAARAKLEAEDKKYRERQDPLQAKAKAEEQARDQELIGGRKRLDQKDLLAYAGMGVQLAIALASVAALTRRKVAFHLAVLIGAIGLAVTAYAVVGPLLMKG